MGPLTAQAVERSAAPAAVAVALDQLTEARPELPDRLEHDEGLREALVAVVAASRSLTRRLVADPGGLEVLADLDTRPALDAAAVDELAGWRHLEFLRIAARDLTGRDGVEAVTRALSALADDVLRTSVRLAGAGDGFAVIAMGKLGARELNYASDIDVLFVGEGPARQVMDVARTCFRVDANLRPEGRDGPLVRSLASYEAYWDQWAEPWEFQALLKARPVAGADALGRAFAVAAADRVWTRPFGADELRSLRQMKARAEGELGRRGLTDREVKRGRGGIRDIEFSIQLLQLVHGRLDPDLRTPATLDALAELASAGYVGRDDADALAEAYRFLRTVEHRLQLVDEQQVHAVPTDADARSRLARVLGYRDTPELPAVGAFERDLRSHQSVVRGIHERLYFRPLLEVFSGSSAAVLVPEAVRARLDAFGFKDAERTRVALEELTRGLTRASRLMQHLLPVLLGWLSESPDPDLGLLGLRTLASGTHTTARLVETFRESNEAARRCCLLLGTSRLFVRALERRPDLLDELGRDEALQPEPLEVLRERVDRAVRWRTATDERRDALARFKQEHEVRVAAGDVLGLLDVRAVGDGLTALAEAVLDAALAALDPPMPMAVIGMGRFGGADLSYASDLDVLVVHDGDDAAAAEGVAEALMRAVKGATPSARLYSLDADLRPEGRTGPLSRTVESYAAYYERWGETWERQALLRARPVGGDPALAARFQALVEEVLSRPVTDADEREIRRMKARIERERIPRGEDPQFHLKLGRGSLSDVEWTAQLLQLRHGMREPGTIEALDALAEAGHLDGDDRDVLVESYTFCERTRNRWFLVKGDRGDSLPAAGEHLAKLARSLDTAPTELREEYRRVTRRARLVVERLFYGAE